MVRVMSQLARVLAYGLGIGEGRHIPDCPNRLHLAPLLSASYRLSSLPALPDSLRAFLQGVLSLCSSAS